MPVTDAWHLYLLDCDGRLYTGISTDPERRLCEHRRGGLRGARFTRGASRLELLWQMRVGGRGEAQRAEYRLRRLKRRDKLAIIRRTPPWEELEVILFGHE